MTKDRALSLFIELSASGLTLSGIYLGSTTFAGSICYLASLVFWFWLVARKQIWGLIPLNGFSLVISLINLWKSI